MEFPNTKLRPMKREAKPAHVFITSTLKITRYMKPAGKRAGRQAGRRGAGAVGSCIVQPRCLCQVGLAANCLGTYRQGPKINARMFEKTFDYHANAEAAGLRFGGQPLAVVVSFKYFGIVFHSSTCLAGCAAAARALLARKAMHDCRARCAELGIEAAPVQLQLFSTMVDSVLSHGAEVWGSTGSSQPCQHRAEQGGARAHPIPAAAAGGAAEHTVSSGAGGGR